MESWGYAYPCLTVNGEFNMVTRRKVTPWIFLSLDLVITKSDYDIVFLYKNLITLPFTFT